MTTQYRLICGSHAGLARHHNAGEAPCGKCREGELRRRLDAERVPNRPTPNHPTAAAVTDAEAADNRAALARALKETQ